MDIQTSSLHGFDNQTTDVNHPAMLTSIGGPNAVGFIKLTIAALVLNFIVGLTRYHWNQRSQRPNKIPPTYPTILPLLGNVIPLVWGSGAFFRSRTSYQGNSTASCIVGLPGHQVYLFQDRDAIRKIWRSPELSSPVDFFVYTFRYMFGVPGRTLDAYRADDSGRRRTPRPGSNVAEHRRLDYLVEHEALRAFSGPGLAPTLRRFRRGFDERAATAATAAAAAAAGGTGEEEDPWADVPDLSAFLRGVSGVALVESMYGPTLMRLCPNFTDDLVEFDRLVPWLARAVPRFLMPGPYRVRDRLAAQLKTWHRYSREHFVQESVEDDGDGDPYWGCAFIRNRHRIFAECGDHDEDAVAALDLGLGFGLISNVHPAATLSVWHIFRDPCLLARIRAEIKEYLGSGSAVRDVDIKVLSTLPLLQSVYAEVLRLYTNIYVMVSSRHSDVAGLGGWTLPRNAIALLNTHVSHRDAEAWKGRGPTKDGEHHPIDTFWADRFLVQKPNSDGGVKTIFSTEGLEASWFPYGGGYSICPGRHLAKSVILYTCASLVTEFDMEILDDKLVLDRWRFGLGVSGPTNKIPFRMRKRREAKSELG